MEKYHNALAADGESIYNTSKLTIINKSTYSLGSNNFKKGAIFNNISVISWWAVSLVEESGIPGENHQSVASHRPNWGGDWGTHK